MACQRCGAVVYTKRVTLFRNIGLIVIGLRNVLTADLCRRCISSEFWSRTLVTFFLGWWGVISFFLTPIFLVANVFAYLGSLSLPLGPPSIGSVPLYPQQYQPPSPGGVSAAASTGSALKGLGAGVLAIGGLFALLVFACCGSVGAMALFGTFLSNRVADAGAACNGTPVPTAAVYVPGVAPGIVVMAASGTGWAPQFSSLPMSLHPVDTTAEVALVLCLYESQKVTLQSCTYTNGSPVVRSRYERRGRLVVARTGAVLADRTVAGPDPAACEAMADMSQTTLDGADVDHDDPAWARVITDALSGGPTTGVIAAEKPKAP